MSFLICSAREPVFSQQLGRKKGSREPDGEIKKMRESDERPGCHSILRDQDDEVVRWLKDPCNRSSDVPLSKTENEKLKPFTFKPARYSGPGKTLHVTYGNACTQVGDFQGTKKIVLVQIQKSTHTVCAILVLTFQAA